MMRHPGLGRHPRTWRHLEHQAARRRPCLPAALAELAAAALSLFGAAAPAAGATPTAPAAARVAFAAPAEGAKLTLGETSIDGPALWTIPGAGPSGISRSVLAWMGTNPAHLSTSPRSR